MQRGRSAAWAGRHRFRFESGCSVIEDLGVVGGLTCVVTLGSGAAPDERPLATSALVLGNLDAGHPERKTVIQINKTDENPQTMAAS